MADFATPADVAARWRPLTSAEITVAETLVGDASVLIRQRFPGIEGQVDPTILTMVVAGMVKRALIAPLDGVKVDYQMTGPYAHSQSFDNSSRNVFLTAADLVLIQGYKPAGGSFAYGNTTIAVGETNQTVYGV